MALLHRLGARKFPDSRLSASARASGRTCAAGRIGNRNAGAVSAFPSRRTRPARSAKSTRVDASGETAQSRITVMKPVNEIFQSAVAPVGILKGFSPVPHQLEVDVVVPFAGDALPGFGEFLLIELSANSALVGRVSRYHTAGQLIGERGDAYLADLAHNNEALPEAIVRQLLRYTLKIQLLGHQRRAGGAVPLRRGRPQFREPGLPGASAVRKSSGVSLQCRFGR